MKALSASSAGEAFGSRAEFAYVLCRVTAKAIRILVAFIGGVVLATQAVATARALFG